MAPDSTAALGPCALRWEDVEDSLERDTRRDGRYQAARWALETLKNRLGEDWLERATAVGEGWVPFGLHLLSFHNLALADALEWALGLELCDQWDGSADFVRDLSKDPRPARILHSRSQLAAAGLAQRLGWPVELEPKIDARRSPMDLALSTPNERLLTEIRVLTQSDSGRRQFAAADKGSAWLMELGLTHRVWVGGELGRIPSEDEQREIEQFIEREAPRAREGQRPRLALDDIELELSERDSTGRTLQGPQLREDLFTRMVRVIADKARKMDDSGSEWLHVTVLSGLWPFTPWGQSPLEEKLDVMASALTDALVNERPSGIVLTSAAGLAPGDVTEDVVRSQAGIGLRCEVRPLRARETLVMPFGSRARAASENWASLALAERDWLDWALDRRGLPGVEELVAIAPGR